MEGSKQSLRQQHKERDTEHLIPNDNITGDTGIMGIQSAGSFLKDCINITKTSPSSSLKNCILNTYLSRVWVEQKNEDYRVAPEIHNYANNCVLAGFDFYFQTRI